MNKLTFFKTFIEFYKNAKTVSDLPLSLHSPPRSKVEIFFQGIGTGIFKNDHDASAFLYGKPPSHPAYIRLKNRLELKLIQQLFLINFTKDKYYSKQGQLYLEGLIQVLAVKILTGIGNNYLALSILKRGIKIADKNKFSETGFLLASIYLRFIKEYSLNGGNPYQDKTIALKLKNFFKNAQLEIEVEHLYSTIIGYLSKGGRVNEDGMRTNHQNLISFSGKLKNLSAFRVIEYYYALSALNIHKKEFNKAIENCKRCILDLKNTKIESIHKIYLLKAQCYIHLNDFFNAKKALQNAEIKKIKPDTNFFAFSDIYFVFFARSGSFGELINLYENTVSNSKFAIRPKLANESWRQYGLLLLLLIKLDKIPPSESLERLKPKLRLGKLLNEMPEYSKDKAGLNMAIRVLHALILLASKKFGEFEEALPPLQAYISRYKRHYPEIFRCDLMVKMLSIIPKVNYDVERTAWRAREHLEKMQAPPEKLPLKITEMEVIPYERLWQFVLEFLGTLKRRPYSSKTGN